MSKTATITQEIEQRDDGVRIVRVRTEDAPPFVGYARIAKYPTQTVAVLSQDGKEIEARLYGRWVTVPLVPVDQFHEDDSLVEIEQWCRRLRDPEPLGLLTIAVIETGDFRALVAFPLPPFAKRDWDGAPPSEKRALSEIEERYAEPWLTTVAIQFASAEEKEQ
jgi:hypothetical protein